MKGMILAAGLGTRLRPLTHERPKAAVPVANVPACAYAARALALSSIRRVAVNLHHLPEGVRAVLGDGSGLGLSIAYSPEPGGILGTGGGIRRALEILGEDTLLVVNGDVVCDLELARLVAAHERSAAWVTLALVEHPDPSRYGAVGLARGHVTSIVGRRSRAHPDPVDGEIPTVFTGISVISTRAQELLPASGCLVRETLFAMLDEGLPLAGFLHRGFWSDIGTPAEYLRANLAVAGGRAGTLEAAGRLEGSCLMGENVRIGPGARIGRDVILGSGAVVEDGADLESCVVWDGARAAGRLRSSIVGREHTVLAGEDA